MRGTLALLCLTPSLAFAYGESVAGFPTWPERVEHEWMNRARCDPQVEMMKCGNACGEAACYKPTAPLGWSDKLAHAARYHSDEMVKQSFFSHPSACTLVQNIGTLYPTMCDGSAACACVGGVKMCNPMCTDPFLRMSLFGGQGSGEIIASPTEPDQAFYLWLFENSASQTCAFSLANGHRWLILTGGPNVGVGVGIGNSTGDFGGPGATSKIPSGSHYPRQAASVEAWANWFDNAGPQQALVDLDGTCTTMTRKRGTDANGAFSATLNGVGTGCHRYYFIFKDSAGVTITYPTTGSLAIGSGNACPDWDMTRPAAGAGCGNVPMPDMAMGGGPGDGGGGGKGDLAGGGDGGAGPDGGTTGLHGGCSCELGRPARPPFAPALLLVALAALRRRRP
jgi:MYXO-CTERM domain-containing protein